MVIRSYYEKRKVNKNIYYGISSASTITVRLVSRFRDFKSLVIFIRYKTTGLILDR